MKMEFYRVARMSGGEPLSRMIHMGYYSDQ